MSELHNSYVHTFISSQIPEHIKDDYELYETFLKAYYEWLCSEGQSLYATGNLQSFTDIDDAPEFFYSYLKNEILTEFPDDVLADKKLLLRYAKDFYERKGTETSYEFLFKVLYNDTIHIKYPADNILKASDGKWITEYSIYVKPVEGDPYNLESTMLYTEDGNVLYTDSVIMIREGMYDVYQIKLSPTDYIFGAGDKLYNEDKSVIVETYGILKDIEVTNGGSGYNIGDMVPVNDLSGNGINAVAMVSDISADNKINTLDVVDGGYNYRVGDQLVFEPIKGGSGAVGYVSEIDVQEVSQQCETTIETEQNIKLNSVKDIKIKDYIKYLTYEVGSIKKVKLVSEGHGYKEMPYIHVSQEKLYDLPEGYGAVIKAKSNSLGKVKSIKVINRGVGYVDPELIEVDLTQAGDGKATAVASVYGGTVTSDGFWKNNDGKLDSTVYLQDNKYYQNFSYVIESSESIRDYKPIVNTMVHPAGTQLYGEISLINEINVGEPFTACDKQMVVHIQKEVIASLEKLIKDIIIHIESSLTAAEIYGYEYFINDFKDEYINKYQNLRLHEFKAIYQDMLIYDIQYLRLEQIWDDPLNTLYGCSRPSVDSAQIAIIKSE